MIAFSYDCEAVYSYYILCCYMQRYLSNPYCKLTMEHLKQSNTHLGLLKLFVKVLRSHREGGREGGKEGGRERGREGERE